MAKQPKRTSRDDFPPDVKELLAKRVGMRCSDPNCRQPTSGPQQDPSKVLNIGVAAHITAASPGGARYDSRLSPDERRSSENGIWLCQNHGKLVDNDEIRYTVDLLRDWKRASERAALLDIESPTRARRGERKDDVKLIRFFAQCFDRPAFQDHFAQEGSMEAFDKAIEDTITALNTGCLRSRDGAILHRSKGKAFLANAKWRDQMDTIVDLLRAIRSRYSTAQAAGEIVTDPRGDRNWYCINKREIAEWMDATRSELLRIFEEICSEAKVKAPRFPRPLHRW